MTGNKVTRPDIRKMLDDDGVSPARIIELIEESRITADELSQIFDQALKSDDPRPTRESYERLAINVAHLREAGWPYKLVEEQHRRYVRVTAAADHLLHEIEAWAEMTPDASRPEPEPAHPFIRLANELQRFAAPVPLATPKTIRGRPKSPWHKYGHAFAKLIIASLKGCGYSGPISKIDDKSATAVICAELMNLIFDANITADGFASAMRSRNRKGRRIDSIFDLFPDALRRFGADLAD